MTTLRDIIRPGLFSKNVAADGRRQEFDYKNCCVINENISVGYVFLGDSIFHYWELNAYFRSKDGIILNREIGSDTTVYMKKRFNADVLQLKPRHVVFIGGANNAVETQQGRDPNDILLEVANDVGEMMDISIDNGIKFILCSITPAYENTDPCKRHYNISDYNILIKKMNIVYKRLADEKKQIYVDFFTALARGDGMSLREGIALNDGVHPEAQGFGIMAGILRKTLAQNGIELSYNMTCMDFQMNCTGLCIRQLFHK